MNTINVRNLDETKFKDLVGNKFFSATFIKGNGEPRTYATAQIGAVKANLRGGVNTQAHISTNVTVKVVSENNATRTLVLPKVTEFKCGDKHYRVVDAGKRGG